MRKKSTSKGLTVNAIAGTHVVLLGFDLAAARRRGCLGFAIQREDHEEDERYWMTGTKTFQSTSDLGLGGQASSRQHPFQSFQWSDYSAKPDHKYTYKVLPLYGTPQQLKEGEPLSVDVTTEVEFGDPHSVFFNRGAVASQEYARRFLNKTPEEAGPEAFKWLSRGLMEAFTTFIRRAKDDRFGIYGAIYEFQWPDTLAVIKEAHNNGADVHVLYDGTSGSSGPKEKNETAIEDAQIKGLCIPRTTGKMMHNKFFVLTKNDKPIAVWTGSTNLTENGIFGHSNVGHLFEDADTAVAYLEYWNELKSNPVAKTEKAWMADNNSAPPDPWKEDAGHVFSPRTGLDVLQWYADIAASAKKGLFMTFAFGMHKFFQDVYEKEDEVIKFALMEKEGNGAGLTQGKIDITRIRKLPNVVVAVAKNITLNSFDRWLQERPGLPEAQVRYIHDKFMLVDPLGDKPVVVTGSANFSKASTDTNNENMLVIRNDKRVADIYLGEFMRCYSHYAFREAVAIAKENGEADWKPNYLVEDDSWQKDYFTDGSSRFLRRQFFAGS